jgi:hypothetical protein
MPRRIRNVLTLASAVLCLGSALLVGRSVFRYEMVVLPLPRDIHFGIGVIDVKLMLWHGRGSGTFVHKNVSSASARPGFHLLWQALTGIRWLGVGWGTRAPNAFLILPLWPLPLLTAIAPVRWWRRRSSSYGARGFAVVDAAVEQT